MLLDWPRGLARPQPARRVRVNDVVSPLLVLGRLTLREQNGDSAKDGGAQGCSARSGGGGIGGLQRMRTRDFFVRLGEARKQRTREITQGGYARLAVPNPVAAPGGRSGVLGRRPDWALAPFFTGGCMDSIARW